MKITREDVLYVAELAHLELSAAEVETYRQQLDSILTYIDKLNQLNTGSVEPMAQVLAGLPVPARPAGGRQAGTPGPEEASWREDQVRPSGIAGDALAAAPDAANHYFRVPKVIER